MRYLLVTPKANHAFSQSTVWTLNEYMLQLSVRKCLALIQITCFGKSKNTDLHSHYCETHYGLLIGINAICDFAAFACDDPCLSQGRF